VSVTKYDGCYVPFAQLGERLCIAAFEFERVNGRKSNPQVKKKKDKMA
jgi:hypothetical protein